MQVEQLAGRWPALATLTRRATVSVGLDLGSTSLKAAALSRAAHTVTLLKTAVLPLPPGANAAQRGQAVQQILQQVEGTQARLVTAVGGPGAVLRWVSLPKMTPKELKVSLAFEAEKHIPFRLEEAFLDCSILEDKPGGRMEVLLAAARKDLVNGQVELLGTAGVVPQVMDLEPVALANAWELSHPTGQEVVGLIHMGARGTLVDILSGPQLQFSRELAIGGEAFTKALAEMLSLDPARAEALKCAPGERAGEVRAALQPRWDEWLTQCRASFDFYENQFGHAVGRLMLTGGSARLAGFREWLQEAVGLPTELWDPLQGVPGAQPAPAGDRPGLLFGVALGLAARGGLR